ncbi:hypothetical protein LTR66_012359, partial [Elasticomyces elasticus]
MKRQSDGSGTASSAVRDVSMGMRVGAERKASGEGRSGSVRYKLWAVDYGGAKKRRWVMGDGWVEDRPLSCAVAVVAVSSRVVEEECGRTGSSMGSMGGMGGMGGMV